MGRRAAGSPVARGGPRFGARVRGARDAVGRAELFDSGRTALTLSPPLMCASMTLALVMRNGGPVSLRLCLRCAGKALLSQVAPKCELTMLRATIPPWGWHVGTASRRADELAVYRSRSRSGSTRTGGKLPPTVSGAWPHCSRRFATSKGPRRWNGGHQAAAICGGQMRRNRPSSLVASTNGTSVGNVPLANRSQTTPGIWTIASSRYRPVPAHPTGTSGVSQTVVASARVRATYAMRTAV